MFTGIAGQKPRLGQTLRLVTVMPATDGARNLSTTTLNGTENRTMTTNSESKVLRCQGCGKLLAEKAATGTVIVCSRCKTRNEVDDE